MFTISDLIFRTEILIRYISNAIELQSWFISTIDMALLFSYLHY